MGTKATAQAIIDAIADGEENTAEEVRALGNVLLNELYSDPISDSDEIELITSKIFSSMGYNLTFKKTGNICVVIGKFKPLSPIGTLQDIIAITDPEFAPNDNFLQEYKIDGVFFRVNYGKITAKAPIIDGSYWISFSYVTN